MLIVNASELKADGIVVLKNVLAQNDLADFEAALSDLAAKTDAGLP